MKRSIFITISIIMIFLLCGTAAEAGQHNNEATNSDLNTITNSDQVYNSNSMILTNSGSKEFSSQLNSPSKNNLKNIIISGIVRNCLSGDLFQGVLITVKSISGNELAKTTTDSNGSYLLSFRSNETIFNLTASYPGHTPTSKEVIVSSNPSNPHDTHLYGTNDFKLSDIVTNKLVCNGTQCKWVKYSDNYKIGDTAAWLITTTNKGPDNATGVWIQDLLPSGLTITNWWVKLPGGNWIQNDPSFNTTTGNWTIGNLGANQTAQLDIWTYINTTGNITNCANGSCATIHINQTADIQVSNSANNTTVNLNDLVMFMLSAFNNGPDDAHDINITDILPTGLIYVNHSVDSGVYNPTTGIWTIDSLGYNKTAFLNITTNATETGSMVNWANKTQEKEYDCNETNDRSNVTITVS